jgi:hypothetical protein
LPPLYDHVSGVFDLNPIVFGVPLKILVKPDIACKHILSTYLFLLTLLTLLAGGVALPLEPGCVPP